MQANFCQHFLADGSRCQAVAIRDLKYCRHHARYYDPADLPVAKADYMPPIPDHPDAPLLSVHHAVRTFLAGNIDEKTCRLLIHAAQVEGRMLHQRLAHEKLADERSREAKKEQEAQQRVEARTNAILDVLRQHGYRERKPEVEGQSQS